MDKLALMSLGSLAFAASAACDDGGETVTLERRLARCGLEAPTPLRDDERSCLEDCFAPATCDQMNAARGSYAGGETLERCVEYGCGVLMFDPPDISFGEDLGQLSASGQELFAKPPANPNPRTLVGVYEETGTKLDIVEGAFVTLSYRIRTEHRVSGIAIAAQCHVASADGGDESTAVAFVTGPIAIRPWGIEVREAKRDERAINVRGTNIPCTAELASIEMPYCVRGLQVPDGFTRCVSLIAGKLAFKDIGANAFTTGTKLSN